MRIRSLLLILTVFLVFASFTSAECCNAGNACIPLESCSEAGYGDSLGDATDGSCEGLADCQIGCCDQEITTQYQCTQDAGNFDPSLTDETACIDPEGMTCCMPELDWTTNLDCFNAGGEGSELTQEECSSVEQEYTISGTVFDETNQTVDGGQVVIVGPTTVYLGIESDGTYSYETAEDETSYVLTATYQDCTASDSVTISGSDVEINLTLDCETLSCSELSAELGYSSSTCCSPGETGTLEGVSGTALEATCEDLNQICWGNANTCEIIEYEESNCLGEDSSITLTASQAEGERKVNVAWEVEGCENGLYDVLRCDTIEETCDPFIESYFMTTEPISTTTYPDNTIGQNSKTYCYGVIGYYDLEDTNNILTSNYECVTFEEIECELPGKSHCLDSTSYELCTEEQVLEETLCEENTVCVDDYEDNTASCVQQHACDLCNGPLGVFLNENFLVEDTPCDQLDTCFIDYAPLVVDNYRKCIEVSSCYDYRSKDSCLGSNGMDTCNRGPCEWMETSTEELGIGVCRPIQEIKQDCSKCEDMTFNNFFGSCNEERCSMMGKCFLDGTCKELDNINCNFFDEESCINSPNYLSLEGETRLNQSVEISVTYASDENGELDPNQRIGGTHQVTQDSDSHFGSLPGFNLCKWFENEDNCGKDADGDFKPDNDAYDMTPPVTNLILMDEENIILPKELNIPIVITDNLQTEPFKTYFSFGKQEIYEEEEEEIIEATANAIAELEIGELYYNYSYPMTEVENNLITTNDITESGNYRLWYYTEDLADNLEVVKSIDVTIDAEMILPNVTWSFSTTETENSTLIINLEVFEQVWCSDELYKVENNGVETLITENLQTTELDPGIYTLTMEVADGSYIHVLECQDVVHNTGTVQTGIGVNAPLPILITIE